MKYNKCLEVEEGKNQITWELIRSGNNQIDCIESNQLKKMVLRSSKMNEVGTAVGYFILGMAYLYLAAQLMHIGHNV